MKKYKSIALAFILFTASASYAQTTEHKHKAPHGGQVQDAGGYHIEMVKGESIISFYVLDSKEKTMSNKALTGNAVFDFFNKTTATATLKKADKNALVLDTPKANVF